MQHIIVRTYGNGCHMNSVYPMYFKWLSQAEKVCAKLNEFYHYTDNSDKWIVMPITEYIGDIW